MDAKAGARRSARSFLLSDLATHWRTTVHRLADLIAQELLTPYLLLHGETGLRAAQRSRGAQSVTATTRHPVIDNPPWTISLDRVANMRVNRRVRLKGYYRVPVADALALLAASRGPVGPPRSCSVLDSNGALVQLDRVPTRRELRVFRTDSRRFERKQKPRLTNTTEAPPKVPVTVDTDPPDPRSSASHRPRCRALAALLWELHPDLTIADMIVRDDFTRHGCEGVVYHETTLRRWINDLSPNRKPGRRPNQK
jgi:hypothetical protein